jgi:hypothetical protein
VFCLELQVGYLSEWVHIRFIKRRKTAFILLAGDAKSVEKTGMSKGGSNKFRLLLCKIMIFLRITV